MASFKTKYVVYHTSFPQSGLVWTLVLTVYVITLPLTRLAKALYWKHVTSILTDNLHISLTFYHMQNSPIEFAISLFLNFISSFWVSFSIVCLNFPMPYSSLILLIMLCPLFYLWSSLFLFSLVVFPLIQSWSVPYIESSSECSQVSDWCLQVLPNSSSIKLYVQPSDEESLWKSPQVLQYGQ